MSLSNPLKRTDASGKPILPPITKPKIDKEKYDGHKLLNYRLANEQQKVLSKIMYEEAKKAANKTADAIEVMPDKANEPDFPSEMMSQDRRIRLNYQFLKKCVEAAPVVPMQKEWFDNILSLIPSNLKGGAQQYIRQVFDEVKEDYERSMRRSNVQMNLVKPPVRGLEEDDNQPIDEEAVGLDFSSKWHESFVEHKAQISSNLHILHPSMQKVLHKCETILGPMLVVDGSQFRREGPIDFDVLKNSVLLEAEKVEEKLNSSWHPAVVHLFADKNNFTSVSSNKLDSFYNCVTCLMSNQLKGLLERSIKQWVNLFDETNKEKLPLLRMELIYDDNQMQFYPTYESLEELILFVPEQISKTLQNVSTVQSFLSGSNPQIVSASVADHILDWARSKLKEAAKRNFEEAQAHLEWFMSKYNWLINGEAESQITKFLEEEHDFEEYCQYIDSLRDVAKQISVLPMIEHYDMIELDCEDLKRGLAEVARSHANRLLERMATDHRNENTEICAEFDHIKERALSETDKSDELMDMISFIENARTIGMIKLNERIKTSFEHLQWMLDVYIFSEEDIELNKTTILWPKRINPVYDQNDELVEKMKQEGEKQLVERREKLIFELNKLKQRVEELDDCGELDMMQTYMQEIRQTQKKLTEAQNEIEWTNTEEKLYKFPVNQYPQVDEITSGIEPFKRLFAVVVAWQKAERKWMDGNFGALDAEQIEGELDEYWRELYKVQKIFNQKVKKLQAEKEERDRERKKKKVPTATLR